VRFKGIYSPERKMIMNSDKTTTAPKTEQPDFVKRIGKTTYKVKVHFNPNSRETMSDKIIRMLRNEVSQSHEYPPF
jgi:hypothetical protein